MNWIQDLEYEGNHKVVIFIFHSSCQITNHNKEISYAPNSEVVDNGRGEENNVSCGSKVNLYSQGSHFRMCSGLNY
jgi:hypothetical protein